MSSAPAENLPQTDLVRYRGDGATLALSLTQPDTGGAFNPTGEILLFTIKEDADDLDADALVQKLSTIGGFTTVDAAAGRVNVALVPADFAELTARKTYEFDVQAQNATTGAVRTVCRGTLYFADDVTKGVTLSIATTTTNPGVGYTWANIPDKPATFAATVSPSVVTTVAGGASVTLTMTEGARWLFAKVTASGTGTAVIVLAATNAVDGAAAALRVVMPAAVGLTVEIRNATAGGTLLASIASDGIAGTVGVILSRGAAEWDEPTSGAWL